MISVGVEPVSSTEDFIITAEASDQVFKAISGLKSTDQEILKLTVWEELSHAEIAAFLGIGVGAVKQRSLIARKNLTREYNRLENKQIKPLAAQKGGRR